MDRRTALQSLVGSAAFLSGCLLSPEPARSDTPMTPDSPTDESRTVSIESIETTTHALRLNDLGASPVGSVHPLSSYSDRERKVLRQAIDGEHETSDPAEWLVEFVSSTLHFQREGQYYRLDNPFPVYTITGETVEERSVEGRIASFEAYREAVTHDGKVMTGLIRVALKEGYETTYLWDGLREFLDTYDAVEYHGNIVRLTLQQEDVTPPYTITATQISPADLTDEAVWDATNASSRITSIVAAAGETEGLYRVNDPPEELLNQLDAHQYVYLEGTFYTANIEKRSPLPVSVDASVTDATLSDRAGIALTLTNDHDAEVEIMTGAPKPFGVLWFHPLGTSDERYLLWTDAYKESQHVQTEGHTVKLVNSIGLILRLSPGETIRHEFRIEQMELQPGQYVIENDVSVSLGDAEDGTLPYRVVLSVSD